MNAPRQRQSKDGDTSKNNLEPLIPKKRSKPQLVVYHPEKLGKQAKFLPDDIVSRANRNPNSAENFDNIAKELEDLPICSQEPIEKSIFCSYSANMIKKQSQNPA